MSEKTVDLWGAALLALVALYGLEAVALFRKDYAATKARLEALETDRPSKVTPMESFGPAASRSRGRAKAKDEPADAVLLEEG